MTSEGAVMDQLKVMAQTSDGRLLALQVSNQIAHEQVDQLMKLRQLMLADLQSKQAYQAMMIQQDATRQVARTAVLHVQRRIRRRRYFRSRQVSGLNHETKHHYSMALVLASCTREPDSPIVRRVEQAGAGNVRNVSDACAARLVPEAPGCRPAGPQAVPAAP